MAYRIKLATAVFVALLCVMAGHASTARADTADEQLAAASALFEAQKYAEAASRLDIFLADYPKHDKAGAAAYALGRCRTELKQYDKAIPAYQKAVATHDTAILTLAQLGLGEAAVNLKQYEKAAPALEGALAGNLKPAQIGVAWLWLGQCYYEMKKFDKSDEAYMHVVHDFPRAEFADTALIGAGLAEIKISRSDEARQRFQTLLDRYPRSEEITRARYLIAQIDLDGKRYQQARSGFEGLINDSRSNLSPTLRAQVEDGLIQTLFALNDYAAAVPRLESALQRLPVTDPEHFRAELSLGNCYYRRKEYQPAASAYLEASRSTEATVAAEGLYWAGNVNLAADHPGDAAPLFARLVARYPKSELAAKSALKSADAYTQAKQTSAAMAAYRMVVDKYPSSPEAETARKALGGVLDAITDPAQLAAALKTAAPADRQRGMLRLGRMYLVAKKYESVAATMTELINLKPDPATASEADYIWGLAIEGTAHPTTAVTQYAESVRLQPASAWSADALGRLAWLYIDLKQPANAEKAANAALALIPDHPSEEQDRLALIQAEIELQKWDAASDACAALLATSPAKETIGSVLYTQAWINEKRGRSTEALPIWERLISDYPADPTTAEALLHVGDARLKAAQYEEARGFYTRIVFDFPKSGRIAEAHFKTGSALFNLDKAADAAAEFIKAADDKTAGEYIPESLYWAGVALDKSDKKAEALQRFTKLVTLYPKHARVTNAKIRIAALKAVLGS